MTKPPVLQYGVPISVTIGMWKGLRKYLADKLPYSVFDEPSRYEQWADEFSIPEINEVAKEIIPDEIKTSKIGVWVQDIYDKFWDMDPRLSIFILVFLVLSPLLTRSSGDKVQERYDKQEINVQNNLVQQEIEEVKEIQQESAHVLAVKEINISPNVLKDELANVPSLAHDNEYIKIEADTRQTPSASTSSLDSQRSKINDSSPHLPLQVSPAKTSNSNAQINNFQAYSQPFTY